MQALIDVIKNFWQIITNRGPEGEILEYNLANLTILQLLLVALFIYLMIKLLKAMFKNTDKALKTSWNGVKKVATWKKRKMLETPCTRCGRTLDKCVCPSNKGLSVSKRYKKHKAELKLQKLQAKAK